MAQLRFAVVGSGPAGFFSAKSLFRHLPTCRVDMFERLPCPYGLIRYGVAPDHAEIKHVQCDFEKIAESEQFRFLGNVPVGATLTHSALAPYYSGLVYAYGASSDRPLGILGEEYLHSARSFVEWYNMMPDAESFDPTSVETLAIVGNGNVALDIARLLSRPLLELRQSELPLAVYLQLEACPVKDIHIIGRRGVMQAACAIKELRQLTRLDGVSLRVFERDMKAGREDTLADNSQQTRAKKRLFELFDSFPREPNPDSRVRIHFHFLQSPIEASETGLRLRRNVLCDRNGQKEAAGTEEYSEIKADLMLKSVGYQCVQIDQSLPFDKKKGVIESTDGRVLASPPTYAAGWCRSGPIGILDSTMRSAFQTVESILADSKSHNLPLIPTEKTLHVPDAVSWREWLKIDQFELQRGRSLSKYREKVSTVAEMLKIARSSK